VAVGIAHCVGGKPQINLGAKYLAPQLVAGFGAYTAWV